MINVICLETGINSEPYTRPVSMQLPLGLRKASDTHSRDRCQKSAS